MQMEDQRAALLDRNANRRDANRPLLPLYKEAKLPLLDKDANAPKLPLVDKESSIEFLQPLSASAFLGITAINVLSSQGQDPASGTYPYLRTFLMGVPYAFFPFGLVGLTLALVASKRRPYLLGFAYGFLLAEILFMVLLGAIITVVRSGFDQQSVWTVTAVVMVAVVACWSMMCAYPKFLRCSGCCADPKVDSSNREVCADCGAITVDGRPLVPAVDGVDECPTCHGVARTTTGTQPPPTDEIV